MVRRLIRRLLGRRKKTRRVVKKTTTKSQCAIGLKGDYAKFLYSLVKKYKPNN